METNRTEAETLLLVKQITNAMRDLKDEKLKAMCQGWLLCIRWFLQEKGK